MALFKKLVILSLLTFFCVLLIKTPRIIFGADCPACSSEENCNQRISCLRDQKTSLTAQIDLIDTQISLTQSRIETTLAKIDKLGDDISSVSGKIVVLEDSLVRNSNIFANRVVKNYVAGWDEPLFYLLTSNDFADFWRRMDYMRIIQEHDRVRMLQMAASKKNYNDQKVSLEEKKKQVETLSSQLRAYRLQLNQQNKDKKVLLSTTQEQLDQAVAQLAAFQSFVFSQGGASLLSNQTKCDDWGCYFNQRDNSWGNQSLNHTGYTLADSGCLVTSMAMVISHYGHKDINPAVINSNPVNFAAYYPAFLNKTITAAGINWLRSGISQAEMDNELKNGRPVIVGIGSGPEHFLVIVSGSSGNYIMNDPFIENGNKISFSSKYSIGMITEIDSVKQN